MKYSLQLKPKALKDLRAIQLKDRRRIIERMELLAHLNIECGAVIIEFYSRLMANRLYSTE